MVSETFRGVPWTKPEDITAEEFIAEAMECGLQNHFGGHTKEDQFRVFGHWVPIGFADGAVATLLIPQQAKAIEPLASRLDRFNPDEDPSHKALEIEVESQIKWPKVCSVGILTLLCILPIFWLRKKSKSDSATTS